MHPAALGPFTGCLSLSSRRTGRLPHTLTIAGSFVAAGMLSPLGLAVESLILLVRPDGSPA